MQLRRYMSTATHKEPDDLWLAWLSVALTWCKEIAVYEVSGQSY